MDVAERPRSLRNALTGSAWLQAGIFAFIQRVYHQKRGGGLGGHHCSTGVGVGADAGDHVLLAGHDPSQLRP